MLLRSVAPGGPHPGQPAPEGAFRNEPRDRRLRPVRGQHVGDKLTLLRGWLPAHLLSYDIDNFFRVRPFREPIRIFPSRFHCFKK